MSVDLFINSYKSRSTASRETQYQNDSAFDWYIELGTVISAGVRYEVTKEGNLENIFVCTSTSSIASDLLRDIIINARDFYQDKQFESYP